VITTPTSRDVLENVSFSSVEFLPRLAGQLSEISMVWGIVILVISAVVSWIERHAPFLLRGRPGART
jgi:hypothetical protein